VKISIIIPVFNRHEYCNRALKSVLEQTYKDWELFIVDDNSNAPYKIPELYDKFNQKITLIRNESNFGPGLSRQRGLDLAKGEFVCFLDSDDYWKSDFLSESLKTHSQNPYICATYCQSEMTDGTLRRRNQIDAEVDDIFYGVVSGVRPWATCSIMWKKQYLGKWDSIRTNQDALFEMKAALNNAQIKLIPKVLCVIDKGTGENSIDIVGNNIGNENRFKVLLIGCNLLVNSRTYKNLETEKTLWFSLFVYWKKMVRQKNLLLSMKGLLFVVRFYKWRLN
jgi:glycosyltransferase involved in cell wall biosynthesis